MKQQGRFILFIFASFLILIAYNYYISRFQPPVKSNDPQVSDGSNQNAGESASVASESVSQNPQKQTAQNDLQVPQVFPAIVKATGELKEVQTEKTLFKINPKTASIRGIFLKDFHAKDSKNFINLLEKNGLAEALRLTLNYPAFDQNPQFKLNASELENFEENKTLSFVWQDETLKVERILKFVIKENDYFLKTETRITNKSKNPLALEPRLWLVRSQKEKQKEEGGFLSFLKGPQDTFKVGLYNQGGFEQIETASNLSTKNAKVSSFLWTALTDRYFLMALVAGQNQPQMDVTYGRVGQQIYTSLAYRPFNLQPEQTKVYPFAAYFGIKKKSALENLELGLEESIDYGWFGFLARPLLWLLIHIQGFVINWGVAIIMLTFLVKLLLHPINKKSMQSMKAMQKLQPELKEIRTKFKDDRQRMTAEMQNLFKRHKVNPISGCLPMLLQLPIYIALYRVLWNSVELYQAPFFGFYTDLSAPDPYMIMPVLLGIFFFLQQKFSPQAATMDSAQRKIMMFMPVMFSVFMIFFPVGLVLYILVNTIMSVIQQYMIHNDLTLKDSFNKLTKRSQKA